MKASLKTHLAIFLNRLRRRRGPALRDQCAKVIMCTCALQLERGEARQLAPTKGATGPMHLSGGAITTVTYRVFDKNSDKVDASISQEPWRAFAQVTMRISIQRDPEFQVKINSKANEGELQDVWVDVEPSSIHTAPGLLLIKHLSEYFPLLSRPHVGPVIRPGVEA